MVQRRNVMPSKLHPLRDVDPDSWKRAVAITKALRPTLTREITKTDAQALASRLGIGVSTLHRYRKRLRANDSVTALLRRSGEVAARKSRLGEKQLAVLDDVATRIVRQNKPVRMVDVIAEIAQRCRAKRIDPPDRRSVDRRLQKEAPQLVIRRTPADTPTVKPAPGKFVVQQPLEVVQIDHTLIDVIVVDDLYRAPIGRPYLSVAIDVASRCVLGLLLSFEAPSATTVAVLLTRIAGAKTHRLQQIGLPNVIWPMSGLPLSLHLDNAAEFHSDALTRGCEQFGISLTYRPLGRPQFGGHIERLIGSLMSRVKSLPGATGSNTTQRKRHKPEQTARLTLKELERWLCIDIAQRYHNTQHNGLQGGTPAAAWSKMKALSRPIKDVQALLIAFLPGVYRSVQRTGIQLHRLTYWHDALVHWIGRKRDVYVQWDPADLSRLYVTLPNKQIIEATYGTLSRPSVSVWEVKAAGAYLRSSSKTAITENALFEAITQQRQIIQGAERANRKVKPKSNRTATAKQQRPNAPIPLVGVTQDAAPVDYSKQLEPFNVELMPWRIR
jgi:putative transposase